MRPLTLDDLLPLADYAARRQEFFTSLQRYLDRYRRVRIGPEATLVFENRQTLWFRVQEVLRVARLSEPPWIQDELDLYNRLLPTPNRLQAALLIDLGEPALWTERLAAWADLDGTQVRLRVGEQSLPAELITCRPEDRCLGAAHWIQLTVDAEGRNLLGDFARPALIEIDRPGYHHTSGPLTTDVRQSLVDDLVLSEQHATANAA